MFIKSIGENSEIVTKQMYEFKDKGDRSLVLRPEATASVVRFHNEFFKNESKKYAILEKCIDMKVLRKIGIGSLFKQEPNYWYD